MRIHLIRALNPPLSDACTEPEPCDRLTKIQLELFQKFPHLRFAISGFSFLPDPEIDLSGTDGETFYYPPHLFQTASDPQRLYFHSVIHCLWLHIHVRQPFNSRYWNLAADIAAACLTDALLGEDMTPEGSDRRLFYVSLSDTTDVSMAVAVYQYLNREFPDPDSLTDLEQLFRMDDHSFWYLRGGQGLGKWNRMHQEHGILFSSPVRRRCGLTPGSRMERIELRKEAKYDFHTYLRRFTVTEEELQLDPDTFDYIPYLYGLEHYGKLPFIEPLEYTDADKVEELVIAIDTSGSCDTQTVQQFLAETRRILTDRRNFFRHMNVHIIQCDSMIQDHRKIESIEDWNRYISDIRIIGRGGTDFTPVFTYTDRLIAEGELHHLKGLLYFTDGDGIYPREAPSYETAFVFTDRRFLDFPVPDWAVRLCLNLNQGETS